MLTQGPKPRVYMHLALDELACAKQLVWMRIAESDAHSETRRLRILVQGERRSSADREILGCAA